MMDEQNQLERIVTHEAKLEAIELAITRMEAKLDAWVTNFVPRNELSEMFRSRDKEIELLKQDHKELVIKIESDKANNKNLWPVWAGVVISFASCVIALLALLK